MEKDSILKESIIILIVCLILAISFIYPEINLLNKFSIAFLGFIIAIGTNILIKKIIAYNLEANIHTKIWEIYYFGFQERSHFKKPVPMVWLTPLLSILTRGALIWMPLLEFEISPRVERIAKRHGLYRFANITEWHLALIVFGGIVGNIIGYIFLNLGGLNELAIISLYYGMWSIIPLSGLDGSKLLFGSRKLWVIAGILLLVTFVWQSMIF
jgi:hypothetical protein